METVEYGVGGGLIFSASSVPSESASPSSQLPDVARGVHPETHLNDVLAESVAFKGAIPSSVAPPRSTHSPIIHIRQIPPSSFFLACHLPTTFAHVAAFDFSRLIYGPTLTLSALMGRRTPSFLSSPPGQSEIQRKIMMGLRRTFESKCRYSRNRILCLAPYDTCYCKNRIL